MTLEVIVFQPRPKRAEITQEQKQEYFNRIKNKNNWKNPINKILILETDDQINDVTESISWFVGGMTEVFIIEKQNGKIKARFLNGGYYKNIGS